MKKSELFFSAIAVPLDYIMLIFAALISYQLRYSSSIAQLRPITFNLPLKYFLYLSFIIGAVWIIIFSFAGLYNIRGTKRFIDEISKIFLACSTGIAVVAALMFFTRYLFDSRFIILTAWILSILFISCERTILRLLQRHLYKYGIGLHRVIFLGQSRVGIDLENEFKEKPTLGFKVIVHIPEYNAETKPQLENLAQEDKFDELILIDPNLERFKILEIIDFVNYYHLDFKYVADLLGTKVSHIDIKTYNSIPVVEVKKTPLDGWGRIFKRTFDIVVSFILIIVFFPLMLVVAIFIKIDSQGPIFFTYKRVGQKRKIFTFLKFRSMQKDSHKFRYDEEFLKKYGNIRSGTPMIKLQHDPRITRVGRIIRRWSMDEFPQLFLVLIGSMSLVGPRPHEAEEVQRYTRPQLSVLTIKPGITGLSQVSGRSDLNFDQEIKLDTYYIENWSLLLDLHILLKTIPAVLKKRKTL